MPTKQISTIIRQRLSSAVKSVGFPCTATVQSSEDGSPVICPACHGELDFSQPNEDAPTEWIGFCLECDRLSLVAHLSGSVSVALLLPTAQILGDRLGVAPRDE
jgi:hypothetical protein